MLTKINHIGVAVHNLEEAMPCYGGLLGMIFKGIEEVAGYQVRVAFFQIGESKIELLEPTGEDSIIYEFLNKNGPGIHHIAYEVDNIDVAIKQLEANGTRMIDRTPRQGAHGTMIAFIHPESSQGILTELCQVGNLH